MRMRVVVLELKILEPEGEDVVNHAVQLHRWQLPRFTRELQLCLLQVIGIEVNISEGVNKLSRLKPGDGACF